jgi:conserved hypothetical protein
MSFSKQVKEELANHWSVARHCQIAEIAAMLSMLGELHITNEESVAKATGATNERNSIKQSLQISTENSAVAKKYFTLLQKTFKIKAIMSLRCNVHIVTVQDEDIEQVLKATKCSETLLEVRSIVMQRACCKRAFIRGAFLASGSISAPEKGYHFEIVCPTRQKAEQLQEVMNSFALEAKIILRKHAYIVYLKESTQIVDVLNVMEAHVALMELENVRILKEVRNQINRKVNCETANINKTVSASLKQKEDILYIRDYQGFQKLPESLQNMAEVRLSHPDASLKELGELMNPPVGKSGVNHRLRKLSMIAEDMRAKQGGNYD